MGINNPLGIKVTAVYQNLLDYWKGKREETSPEQAWNVLQDTKNVAVNTNSEFEWKWLDIGDFKFKKGQNIIKVYVNKGGFNFAALMFN